MAETGNNGNPTHDVVATRTFNAPVERVWNAWVDPEQVMRWWGPNGYTAPVARMDVRVGGASLVSMRSPEGHEIFNTWTYTTIEPQHLLEFDLAFADRDGAPLDPTTMGLPPGIPERVHHVITFRDLGDGRTEMTVTEHGYGSAMVADVSKSGLDETLDKLAAAVAG
jgi:uncharacterized protein YndB with AHSA1/START domain